MPQGYCPSDDEMAEERRAAGLRAKFEIELDIDFPMLRDQKCQLVMMGIKAYLTQEQSDALEGVISLLEHIQDHVVDSGIAKAEDVFSLEVNNGN